MNLRKELEMMREVKSTVPVPEGYHYCGPEDFVLQHGTLYEGAYIPEGIPQGQMEFCFNNSINNAALYGWKYIEGYATVRMSGGEIMPFSIHHAWNADDEGRAIDTTWPPGHGAEYFGVEFSFRRADYATWHDDGTVLQNPKSDWEIFRQPWTGEDHSKVWPESPMLKHLLRVKALKDSRRRAV